MLKSVSALGFSSHTLVAPNSLTIAPVIPVESCAVTPLEYELITSTRGFLSETLYFLTAFLIEA